ncbi:hypothetical protein C5Y93_15765 [Blastopirellula marina]|uniref:DUF3160 domain-containing protein n=2 Tax=Blastopirellula marina TaxID=124 RepID=A0A2S8GKS2_9BACT|nr:hypothetical protein C5Y93_15765 [Blastopirellula marina]
MNSVAKIGVICSNSKTSATLANETDMSRKRKTYLTIIGGGLLLFVGMLAWSIFGPSRAIVVSQETTFFVEPLTSDGRVDYARHLRELRNEGVTPQNNAAVPIVLATWPGKLELDQQRRLCESLGIDNVPTAGLTEIQDSPRHQQWITEWASAQWQVDLEDAATYDFNPDFYVSDATYYPWRREQIPPLAQWVDDQQPYLDRLHDLEGREYFYWPSKSQLQAKDFPLYEEDSDWPLRLRAAIRGLCLRVNMHIGEGDAASAWSDLKACWLICRIGPRAPSELDLTLRFALEAVVTIRTHYLLSSDHCDEALLTEIADFLQQLPPPTSAVDAADNSSRFASLEGAAYHPAQAIAGLEGQLEGWQKRLTHLPYDRNSTLQRINQSYDDVVAVLKIQDYQQFAAATSFWEEDAHVRFSSWSDKQALLAATLSQSARGVFIADMTYAGWANQGVKWKEKENRCRQEFRLLQVAVAIVQYKTIHGAYPAALDDLADVIEPELTQDLYYSGQPLVYQRRDLGFLLYSVYLGSTDNGGDSLTLDVIDGEWVAGNETGPFIEENLDLVVRYPMPNGLKLEKPLTKQELNHLFMPPAIEMPTAN